MAGSQPVRRTIHHDRNDFRSCGVRLHPLFVLHAILQNGDDRTLTHESIQPMSDILYLVPLHRQENTIDGSCFGGSGNAFHL